MSGQQRGVAIVLAMGVVATIAIAAAAIFALQSAWARQTELAFEHAQAKALIHAGGDLARAILANDLRSSSVDHLGEIWALPLSPVPIHNGEVAGRIDDQQGAFKIGRASCREGV